MKTLFLSSAGVRFPIVREELVKILPKPLNKIKLAHIITASKVEKNPTFVEFDQKVLEDFGIQVEKIDISGKNEKELTQLLGNKDVVYVNGGNGFYLMKKVYESGFDKVIKKLINKGLIYVGVSAGTYIACPTIEMHEWKKNKDDHYGLTDLRAMNLVPFLISVHYNREKYREKIKQGIAKTKLLVKILTDNQALLIKDDEIQLVGEGKEVKINP